MGDAEITEYGGALAGPRSLGLDLDGVRVLLTATDESDAPRARQIAERLVGSEADLRALSAERNAARTASAALRERIQRLEAMLADQRAINLAAITGRRRFFGPVLLRPDGDGWRGAVWLLDPEKKDSGRGLRFASVAEVRALHPELWVVAVTEDGVLLDAWAAPAPGKDGGR